MTEPAAPPAPAPNPFAAPTGTPPAPAPRTPDPDDGIIDPEDPEGDLDLTRDQRQNRLNRRLRSSARTQRERAELMLAENTALKTRIAQLETQAGSVTKLRQSVIELAIRAQAAGMVVPEALDDACKLIDTTDLLADDTGQVDRVKIRAKLEEFLKTRPHLVASQSARTSTLPGGHVPGPQPAAGSHALFNEMVRQAAGRR